MLEQAAWPRWGGFKSRSDSGPGLGSHGVNLNLAPRHPESESERYYGTPCRWRAEMASESPATKLALTFKRCSETTLQGAMH